MYGSLSIRSGHGEQHVVRLEQVPRWVEQEPTHLSTSPNCHGGAKSPDENPPFIDDPLTGSENGETNVGNTSKFALDHDVNAKLYLWRGTPWALEVDAVVNSSNENLDEAHSSPGLHSAAGPELAEECATLGGCRTGMAKITNGYDLPARRVIHTVGPRYAVRYHTAAENALSHCYRSCLELLVEHGLQSIALGCIYTESKGYPREPAAHVAIRTVRRFLEKHKDKINAVVFCSSSATDTEIYKRLLPLYFPRYKYEEETAATKLPVDVGDENGETVITERKIRIAALPGTTGTPPTGTPHMLGNTSPVDHSKSIKRGESFNGLVDPGFMSMTRDPDQRRKEQREKAEQAQSGWAWGRFLGLGGIGAPALSATEQNSLHGRSLARANAMNLTEIAEMKILYRGGVDIDGRPVMVVVGAHFLLRCLDLERFVLYVVKEFEPLISRPYSIVYFHSAATLQLQPDLGLVKRIHQILGRRHEHNLHAIYILHPTLRLRVTVFALQLLVEPEVWKKVVYVERLQELFRYVPQEQLTIPDFVFQ